MVRRMFKHTDRGCYYPKWLYETGDQTNVASNDTFQRGTWLASGASLKCFFFHYQKETCKTVCLVLVGLGTAVLTTFTVFGDAP